MDTTFYLPIFLPLQPLFQLPRIFYCFMELFSMHSLTAFTPVLCDSGLQRGRGVGVGVWAETSHWHFESMILREKEKTVVRRFCKVMVCGREVERVCVYDVWDNRDQERQGGRYVVLWSDDVAVLIVFMYVYLNISNRRISSRYTDNHMSTEKFSESTSLTSASEHH